MPEWLKNLFRLSPEKREQLGSLKKLAAAIAFYRAVNENVDPDRRSNDDENKVPERLERIVLLWLTSNARDIFPTIDEFEVREGLIINHPDHDTRDKHYRFSMRQLKAWIDLENHRVR